MTIELSQNPPGLSTYFPLTKFSGQPFFNRTYLPYRYRVNYYGSWISPENWNWSISHNGYAEYALRLAQLSIPTDEEGKWPSLSAYAYAHKWFRIFYQQDISQHVGVFNLSPNINRYFVVIAARDAWIDPTYNIHRKILSIATIWKTYIPKLAWRLWVADISEIPNIKLHQIRIRQGIQVRNTNLGQLDEAISYLKRILEVSLL